MCRFKCKSLDDTKKLAYKFAKLVENDGCFVNLFGEIGAGKTAFVKLVAEALGIKEKVTYPQLVTNIRQKRHFSCSFDSNSKRSLVLCTSTSLASWQNFTFLGCISF